MAVTLSACYPMVIHAEQHRLGYQYAWIIRLRTDGLYTFTWGVGSDWTPPPAEERVVYTTHCQHESPFTNTDCTVTLPREQQCIADQFAVMSRGAAHAYFLGSCGWAP